MVPQNFIQLFPTSRCLYFLIRQFLQIQSESSISCLDNFGRSIHQQDNVLLHSKRI
jgi:hypothetical protein